MQLYKIWFCYGYIYRNYMKHALIIKNIKCIQGNFIFFNMEFVLQIYTYGTMQFHFYCFVISQNKTI